MIGKAMSGGVQAGLSRPRYQAPGLNSTPDEAATAQVARKTRKTARSIRCSRNRTLREHRRLVRMRQRRPFGQDAFGQDAFGRVAWRRPCIRDLEISFAVAAGHAARYLPNMTDTNSLAIALAQLNPVLGDVSGNAGKVRTARARAASQGADLVVFSELFLSC